MAMSSPALFAITIVVLVAIAVYTFLRIVLPPKGPATMMEAMYQVRATLKPELRVVFNVFDLATPDPDFRDFVAIGEDQLPGSVYGGAIRVFVDGVDLRLYVTEEQQYGSATTEGIFEHLAVANLPVLGPNVGEFLRTNPWRIPKGLPDNVRLVFAGKIYRNGDNNSFHRYVRYLRKGNDGDWEWCHALTDGNFWNDQFKFVVLNRAEKTIT